MGDKDVTRPCMAARRKRHEARNRSRRDQQEAQGSHGVLRQSGSKQDHHPGQWLSGDHGLVRANGQIPAAPVQRGGLRSALRRAVEAAQQRLHADQQGGRGRHPAQADRPLRRPVPDVLLLGRRRLHARPGPAPCHAGEGRHLLLLADPQRADARLPAQGPALSQCRGPRQHRPAGQQHHRQAPAVAVQALQPQARQHPGRTRVPADVRTHQAGAEHGSALQHGVPAGHRHPAAVRQRRPRRIHLGGRCLPVRPAHRQRPVRGDRRCRALPRHGAQGCLAADPTRAAGLLQRPQQTPATAGQRRPARPPGHRGMTARKRGAAASVATLRASFLCRVPV
ncbi:UNVERIFIED_CONTAM: hypothetical protein NCL1_60352 [Trichonephila clavipes]